MATSNNEEIFLADSQGWKEEAQAVIKDVKEQVKDINISDKLQVITSLKSFLCATLSRIFSPRQIKVFNN